MSCTYSRAVKLPSGKNTRCCMIVVGDFALQGVTRPGGSDGGLSRPLRGVIRGGVIVLHIQQGIQGILDVESHSHPLHTPGWEGLFDSACSGPVRGQLITRCSELIEAAGHRKLRMQRHSSQILHGQQPRQAHALSQTHAITSKLCLSSPERQLACCLDIFCSANCHPHGCP